MWFAGLPPITPMPNDTVELWHVEQSADVVWCPAPCGFGVTPANTLPAAPTAWQVTQPLAMPTWFIVVPAKLVEVAAAWQLSHVAGVGMWLPGLVFTVTPVKVLPVSWQVAQPLVMPAWFIGVPGPNAAVDLWQVAQSALVGMWPVPCAFGVTPVNAIPVGLAA